MPWALESPRGASEGMPAACHFYSEILKVDSGNYSFICNFIIFFFFFLIFGCAASYLPRGLSLDVASGSRSLLAVGGLLRAAALLLRSAGSRRAGFRSCGSRARELSCSRACGIVPDQGSNLCLLHGQADSQPRRTATEAPRQLMLDKRGQVVMSRETVEDGGMMGGRCARFGPRASFLLEQTGSRSWLGIQSPGCRLGT